MAAARPSREVRDALAETATVKEQVKELQRELAEVMRKRNASDRENKELRSKVEELETKRNDVSKQPIKAKRTFARRSEQVATELARHHPDDLPRLTMAALKRVAKKKSVSFDVLFRALVMSNEFKVMRDEIFALRDEQIYKHLRENVYMPEHFALLRLVIKISKRECQRGG